MRLISKTKAISLLLALTLLPSLASSQSVSDTLFNSEVTTYIVIGMVFLLALIILGVAVNVYDIIRTLVSAEAERKAKEAGVEYVPEPGWFTKLMARWNRIVPLEEEKSITLDHEYDGIRELDNHLPPWWLALFYGSMVFAVIYLVGYHVMDWWPLQEEEYEIKVAEAALLLEKSGAPQVDENTVVYDSDPTVLASGKSVYDQSCAVCHGASGEGGAGPNLTDKYWLHGGSISDIYRTIKNGVPSRGMTSWEKALPPAKIAQVSSYIMSLGGTEPANPKAPQGEIYEPEVAEPEETSEPEENGEPTGDTEQNE